MIINLFLKNKLIYKDIQNTSNILLTIAGTLVSINCIYDIDYELTVKFLLIYLGGEFIFLPINKIDTIIHHILTICTISYVLFTDAIDLNTNFYSTKIFLLTETSSIFLGISQVLKKSYIGTISQILFVLLFFKTRIYDYIYKILLNPYFYESLGNENFQRNWQYMCTYGLFSLQLYWGCIILKVISKPFFKNLKQSISENILRYTYFINFITTATSYTFLLGSNENKLIYGDAAFLDVVGNGLLSISSYYFHNNYYESLIQNNNLYSIANTKHKNYLLLDIATIDIRVLTQYLSHMSMHQIYSQTHINYAIFYIALSLIQISAIDTIYYYHIRSKKQFTDNTILLLNLLMGIPPAIGILASTYNIPENDIILNTFMQILLTGFVLHIQPLYNFSQIMVHLLMCLNNYQLVCNNTYYLRNTQ